MVGAVGAVMLTLAAAAPGDDRVGTDPLRSDFSALSPALGPAEAATVRRGVDVARDDFFSRYGGLFGLGSGDRMVAYADGEDLAGYSFTRFRQHHAGVPVYGSEIVLTHRDERVIFALGAAVPGLTLATTPRVAATEAAEAAVAAVARDRRVTVDRLDPSAELAIVPEPGRGTTYRLAYRVTVGAPLPVGRHVVDIDAATGGVLAVSSSERNEWTTQPAVGSSQYDGLVPFPAQTDGVGWRLRDDEVATFNALGLTDELLKSEITDDDGVFDTAVEHVVQGVSVHWAAERTLDYFSTLGWNGIANAPDIGLTNLVLWDSNWKNAAFMVGDDGKPYTVYGSGPPPHVALETVAHEVTHGVEEYAVGLVYANESGALSESFADIFGVVVDFATRPQSANWLHGETYAKLIRTFEDPDAFCNDGDPITWCYPDTYLAGPWIGANGPPTDANDQNWVHTNMGVGNYWFYLLSEGTPVGPQVNDNGWPYAVAGIGIDAAAKIAFTSLTTKLSPSSGYEAAALGSLQAAIGLYGEWSQARISTQNAWYAVGVTDEYDETPYASPTDGAVGVEPWEARLEWEQGLEESSWTVEVSETDDFASVVKSIGTSTTGMSNGVPVGVLEVALKPDTHYWWRVRKSGTEEPAGWRPVQEFTTATKHTTLIGPKSNARTRPSYPWDLPFSWNEVGGTAKYRVEVSTEPTFATLVLPPKETTKLGATLDVLVEACGLGCENPVMYWRVMPVSSAGVEGTSEVAKLETSMPHVEIESPKDDELVYPWRLPLKWTAVPGAAYYTIELSKDEAHFTDVDDSGSGDGVQKSWDLKPQNPGDPPPTTDTIDLRPFPTPANERYYWRVRVHGPEPLAEQGEPSDVERFGNDGDKTIVDAVKPELTPPWIAFDAESMPVKFVWNHVPYAKAYELRAWSWDENDFKKNVVFTKPIPREDPAADADGDPAVQEETVNLAANDWEPGLSEIGYAWAIVAVGPDGSHGVSDWHRLIYVLPDDPVILTPANGQADVPPEANDGLFSFESHFNPSADYIIAWYGDAYCSANLAPSYASNDGSSIHSVSLVYPFASGETYSWRVRPYSTNGVANAKYFAESWSACSAFTTQPEPPPTPQPIEFVLPGADVVPAVAVAFQTVAGAVTYEIDAYPVTEADQETPTADATTWPFTEDALAADTAYVTGASGVSLPAGGVWAMLDGTDPAGWYRYRLRACNAAGCSEPSGWWHYHQNGSL
jgi:Zn-dependent metalloprotease